MAQDKEDYKFFEEIKSIRLSKNIELHEISEKTNVPKINKKVLQRHLINGLDSSSRETNVFDYFKIPLYQPYCTLVDLYKSLSYQDLILPEINN